jgi:DNA-binding transcriptional MerR regulator
MLIGELAKRSGLSPSRIRFYEAQGLISVTRRVNGYRTYAPGALVTLEVITTAQQAGFPLKDIRGFLLESSSGGSMGRCCRLCGRKSATLMRCRSACRRRERR